MEGGIPTRQWTVAIYLVGPDGDNVEARCYEKATYHLHESFGPRQKQIIKSPPFLIKEKGWGEFDMTIILTPVGAPKGGDQTIQHDLNFQQEEYESTHSVVCCMSEWITRGSFSWNSEGKRKQDGLTCTLL